MNAPEEPRVLGVITARGGSKGVPRKNIRPLNGTPLLAYTAEAVRAACRLTRAVLSTEDEEIARCGRQHGVEVPFLRPAELARDDTPTLPVLQHAVRMLEPEGQPYDAVCLLQPTSPFRTPGLIDACIDRLFASEADSVVTVHRVPDELNPEWLYLERDGRLELATGRQEPIARRQDLPPAFRRSGSVYVVRRDVLMNQGSLYGKHLVGYETSTAFEVNIDTPDDWNAAERLAAKLGGR